MKGPGIATVSFGNCGKSGAVILSVGGKEVARVESGQGQVPRAFKIANTAEVQLTTEGANAVISVSKVVIHCIGGRRAGVGAVQCGVVWGMKWPNRCMDGCRKHASFSSPVAIVLHKLA